MRKYVESKTTRIMMATVPHVTSGFGLRKFQASGFLVDRVYHQMKREELHVFYSRMFCMGLRPNSDYYLIRY